MSRRTAAVLFAAVITAGAAADGSALAQEYPSKPIRIVTPYGPGGTADIMARLVAQKLTEAWGQPVVVENRPGASGMIGTNMVAKAAPDGYTLLAAYVTEIAIAPRLYPDAPYDPLKDLAPIAITALTPMVLVMTPSVPARDLKEFLALAKNKPGQYAYASAGKGSPAHLAGEVLQRAAGVEINHVPYKGGGQALTDTLGGHTAIFFSSMPSAMPHVKAGKLRAIAVSSARRSPAAPDVSTVAEATGFAFDITAWNGLFAPAGTPQDIVDKLNAEVTKALTAKDIQQRLAGEGAETVGWSSKEVAEFVKSETAKFAGVIRDANVKAD
jgi:tripartite-type tricarboxylate transporter receptor subunit TctC